MVIALAINNGFRETSAEEPAGCDGACECFGEASRAKESNNGKSLARRLRKLPNVVEVAPSLYGPGNAQRPSLSRRSVERCRSRGGREAVRDACASEVGVAGKAERARHGLPGIVLGARLAQSTGMMQDSVMSGDHPERRGDSVRDHAPQRIDSVLSGFLRVGFYELDSLWAYISLRVGAEDSRRPGCREFARSEAG